MIEESGVVVALDGDHAIVETSRRSSCGECETKGCGTGTLSQILGRKSQQLRVKNPVSARPGERVVLGISESALIRGSMAVYMVPLMALLFGGLLGEQVGSQLGAGGEGVTILFALLALGLSLLWLGRFNREAATDERYNAVIVRVETSPLTNTIHFNRNHK
ncbi:MAG: SoxR reducing system RseC family protein [Chromatiales bacterium]|nr:SoxR reducing system RseC family protein [Chromatiales bacterium]